MLQSCDRLKNNNFQRKTRIVSQRIANKVVMLDVDNASKKHFHE